MQAAEFSVNTENNMTKLKKAILLAVFAIFVVSMAACGENKLENWPKDKFVKGVPVPAVGVVEKAMVTSDVDGDEYAMIIISEFTANDVSAYISHIMDRGWETYNGQQLTAGGMITYSATDKSHEKILYVEYNTSNNKLYITIE